MKVSNYNNKGRVSEQGLFIILTAFAAIVLVGLCALLFGIGQVATERSNLRNIANAAALAAIQEWVAARGSGCSTHQPPDCASRAVAKANELLGLNTIEGLENQSAGIGTISLLEDQSSAGLLQLGQFVARCDGESNCVCPNDETPCFLIQSPTDLDPAKVNGARVVLQLPSTNMLVAPFAGIFGKRLFSVRAEATATLVSRCTEFLLDVSVSTTEETHKVPVGSGTTQNRIPNMPRYFFTNPTVPGLFAMDSSVIDAPGDSVLHSLCLNIPDFLFPDGSDLMSKERSIWCNTRARRITPSPYTPSDTPWADLSPNEVLNLQGQIVTIPSNPGPEHEGYSEFHYRDDYRKVTRQGPPEKTNNNETLLIDSYVDQYYQGPEPLTSFFLAFNTALRKIQQQQTPFDYGGIIVFAGDVVDTVPPFLSQVVDPGQQATALTNDLGYLVQVTNAKNRGTFSYNSFGQRCGTFDNPAPDPPGFQGPCDPAGPEIHPNFIDHGWYTRVEGPAALRGTNLVLALDKAIRSLTNSCPASSKKQIILATDGVSTCSAITHDLVGNLLSSPDSNCNCSGETCAIDWGTYIESERQLLGKVPGLEGGQGQVLPYPSILQRLQESEIALTVLLRGSGVEPNQRNVVDNTPPGPTPPPYYLDYMEAMDLGFGAFGLEQGNCGYGSSFDCNFFNNISTCPAELNLPTQESCEQAAYVNFGKPGFTFRRPNGVLGYLSIKSGGLWCPLMPVGDPTWYDEGGNLLDSHRDFYQAYSLTTQSLGQTAADCASRAVGLNPFMLAEPQVVAPAS